MSDTVIRVENLGKKYLIDHQQEKRPYKALRDVIADGAKSLLKPIQHSKLKTQNSTREEFWALKDVSFEIKQGDRVGIIGRNGAGKSTLLKLLSRITEPSNGRIQLEGRVASLLEVGTGFHPELTGRENIYLNGAILGMTKAEIKRKFDEIVAFAEVEKFLDTPVKRYSSGMYVRLAFAVAAHLDPEILIIDEVLAVGDSAFQKKCLGKMEEVSRGEGRTILFVSHNMGVVQELCTHGILLDRGQIVDIGLPSQIIGQYLERFSFQARKEVIRGGSKRIVFDDGFYTADESGKPCSSFFMGDIVCVYFHLISRDYVESPLIGIQINSMLGEAFAHIVNFDDKFNVKVEANKRVGIKVEIPNVFFTPSNYYLTLWVGSSKGETYDELIDCIPIEILQGNRLKRLTPYPSHVKTYLPSCWNQVD